MGPSGHTSTPTDDPQTNENLGKNVIVPRLFSGNLIVCRVKQGYMVDRLPGWLVSMTGVLIYLINFALFKNLQLDDNVGIYVLLIFKYDDLSIANCRMLFFKKKLADNFKSIAVGGPNEKNADRQSDV